MNKERLKLIIPTKEYKNKVIEYRKIFLENKESFDGCAGLEECKAMNINKVLITCDKENIGSVKTIIANGGVLENEIIDKVGLSKSGTIQRY